MKMLSLAVLALFVVMNSCGQKTETPTPEVKSGILVPDKRIELWNGRGFSGLNFYLEDSGIDPHTVWSIKEDAIYCGGVPSGYLYTEGLYGDYQLHLEWRWTEEPGNSGVLLHTQSPDTVWPKSIEAQLKSGNAGDFYLIGGTTVDQQIDKSKRRIVKQNESNEYDAGQWNTYDITCRADSIILVVNGLLQNQASGASVRAGKICLQSEGKPIEFRGDCFGIFIAWKWSFKDADGNRVSMILQHNLKDPNQKMGNNIKLTMWDLIDNERNLYEQRLGTKKEKKTVIQPKEIKPGEWEQFIPK